MTCTTGKDPNRYRDARHVLMIAQITPGLPFPQISRDRAEFRFSGITHAEDARERVFAAVAALSKALGVRFTPWWPTPIGSAAHCIMVALLPSGMQVELVALAEHVRPEDFDEDAPQDAPELVAA